MSGAGTVTVSMPYWRCPDRVRQAVTAVLEQTHRDLRLVVVNDGDRASPPWPALADIDDPRLQRVELPDNRGRYYCDAVTLAACRTRWFAIHDADDRAEPDWLAALLAAAAEQGWQAVFAPQRVHRLNGTTYLEPAALSPAGGPTMRHLAHHAAVYRTDLLRKVGGPHPGFRVGYDTLMVNLVAMAGAVGLVDRPLYHRIARPGSLTSSPATGWRSHTRRRARHELNRLYQLARTRGPATVVTSHVPPGLAAAVAADAAAVAAGKLTPRPATPAGGALAEPLWGGWALDRHTAVELAAYLRRARPPLVVECGSGASTLLLGEYARDTGATCISLEHSGRYAERTRKQLADRGLTGRVDVRHAPLGEVDTPAGRLPWYTADLPDGIALALVDGPPGTVGRAAAGWQLADRMADSGWQIWCDDADRDGERTAVERWARDLRWHVQRIGLPKGLAVLHPQQQPPQPVDAGDVAVTILTGRRPQLLSATVAGLQQMAPGLLDSAWVTVLNNGGDRATAELLDSWPWIDRRLAHDGPPLGHGPGTCQLIRPEHLADRPYLLHLEDDWLAATATAGWLDLARQVLAGSAQVGQVRLRHRGDPVRGRHMVSGEPISWQPAGEGVLTGRAHYTLNPSLMRGVDACRLWPASDEAEAMHHFHRGGGLVAQLDPGVFRHIGGGASLHPGRRW